MTQTADERAGHLRSSIYLRRAKTRGRESMRGSRSSVCVCARAVCEYVAAARVRGVAAHTTDTRWTHDTRHATHTCPTGHTSPLGPKAQASGIPPNPEMIAPTLQSCFRTCSNAHAIGTCDYNMEESTSHQVHSTQHAKKFNRAQLELRSFFSRRATGDTREKRKTKSVLRLSLRYQCTHTEM